MKGRAVAQPTRFSVVENACRRVRDERLVILVGHVDRARFGWDCEGDGDHVPGDVPADGSGELSGWTGAAAGSEIRGAVPRAARAAKRRERAGEIGRAHV